VLVADWLELVLGGPLVGLYPEDFSKLSASELESFGLDNVCSKTCETM